MNHFPFTWAWFLLLVAALGRQSMEEWGDRLSHVGSAVLRRLESDDTLGQRGEMWDLTGNAMLRSNWLQYTPPMPGRSTKELVVAKECTQALDGDGCNNDFRLFKCNASSACQAASPQGAVPTCQSMLSAKGESLCIGHSDMLYEKIYGVITQTRRHLDISTLSVADERFLAAVRNAMTYLHSKHQEIDIRIMLGLGTLVPKTDIQGYIKTFLDDILRDVKSMNESSLLRISTAMWEENYLWLSDSSWNHAKIIAVDDWLLFTGGHNMYTLDYLKSSPIFDLSMEVEGPTAMHAHRYLDVQWKYVCSESKDGWINGRWFMSFPEEEDPRYCPPIPFVPQPPAAVSTGEGVPTFTVGRVGCIGEVTSDHAIHAMFDAANASIRLALQDLGPMLHTGVPFNWWIFGHRWVMVALCKALVRGVEVSIIQSGPSAQDAYGVGWSPADVASMAMWYLYNSESYGFHHQLTQTEIRTLVCKHFSVADMQYTAEENEWVEAARCPAQWLPPESQPGDCNAQGSKSIGAHTKFWMIDDVAFYIGSQNLYPSDLAEWGVIVDDPATAKEVKTTLWEPLWQASMPSAPTGPHSDLEACLGSISIPTFPLDSWKRGEQRPVIVV